MIDSDQVNSGADYAPLLILDDIFPHALSPFRTIEYEHYLRFFDAIALSSQGWSSWVGNQSFEETVRSAQITGEVKDRILPFRLEDVAARLAYVTFLRGAVKFLPYLEAKQLPFILQLYPGGGMAVDQANVDDELRRVLHSPLLRRVITTQTATRDYIEAKIGCDPAKIAHIYGGVFRVDDEFDFSRDKAFFGTSKDTIDLCFVAHRYGRDLVSKGYDRFIAAGKVLATRFPELRFHVVGGYDRSAVPVDELDGRITFYGVKDDAFFRDFYPRMDAILSLNRPFVLMPGAYDGFPTGACMEAGSRGVLNCINDPLGMNPCFVDGKDFVLLDEDLDRTIERLTAVFRSPERMYALAYANWRSFRRVFDTDRQLMARTKIIVSELVAAAPIVISPRLDRSVLDQPQFSPPPAPPPAPLPPSPPAVAHPSPAVVPLPATVAPPSVPATTPSLRRRRAAVADREAGTRLRQNDEAREQRQKRNGKGGKNRNADGGKALSKGRQGRADRGANKLARSINKRLRLWMAPRAP